MKSSSLGEKYQVMLIDPPWMYNSRKTSGERLNKTIFGGGAEKHYKLMTDEELLGFKQVIDGLADDNCILFMWATCPRLDFAIKVMQHYGFTFKTVAFTWVKVNKDQKNNVYRYNPGYYTLSNAEIVLLGTRGKKYIYNKEPVPEIRYKPIKAGFAKPAQMFSQIVATPIRVHSQKPDEVIERIELMYPNYKKIEMYSRSTPYNENWKVFGNEVGKFSREIRDGGQ